MRIVILYNPVAGAGRAAATARARADHLIGGGHDVTLVESRVGPTRPWLDAALDAAELLVVAGGDGAMRMAAPSAVRTATPVFHLPLGTENLFSREFGMDARPETLDRALAEGVVREVDVGLVNGCTFLLMFSVGFDAEVVHDLAGRRKGAISHLSYAPSMIRQFAGWSSTRMTVIADGQTVVDAREGMVVVANSRQYARRLDPAYAAQMDDGLLDAVFMPASTRFAVAAWGVTCALGQHERDPRLVYEKGAHIAVTCEPARRFQIDGDAPAEDEPVERLEASLIAERLRVLAV